MKITNPHYANMAMPAADMSVRDWPKWVYPNGPKSGVIVQNAEEEASVLAGAALSPMVEVAAPAVPTVTLAPDNNEKAILLALAKEKGIKVDARWALPKLRAAMEAAQPQVDG